jgi:hypothetical protein
VCVVQKLRRECCKDLPPNDLTLCNALSDVCELERPEHSVPAYAGCVEVVCRVRTQQDGGAASEPDEPPQHCEADIEGWIVEVEGQAGKWKMREKFMWTSGAQGPTAPNEWRTPEVVRVRKLYVGGIPKYMKSSILSSPNSRIAVRYIGLNQHENESNREITVLLPLLLIVHTSIGGCSIEVPAPHLGQQKIYQRIFYEV